MRYFKYQYPDEKMFPVEVVMSEQEILHEYFPFWIDLIIRRFPDRHLELTFHELQKMAIDDWIVSHWAWEVNEDGSEKG